VILEDLQSRTVGGPGYDDETWFDFGISEDDDEVNSCTLTNDVSEAFNDVVFDEDAFGSGLEPYSTSVSSQHACGKPASPRSSVLTFNSSSHRSSKRSVSNLTSSSLPFGVSDDDDSNQIMVSMGSRRKSREWEGLGKIETKSESQETQHFKDVAESSFDTIDTASTNIETDTSDMNASTSPPEAITSDVVSVELNNKIPNESTIPLEIATNSHCDSQNQILQAITGQHEAISPKSMISPNSKSPSEEPRRSGRAVKVPAWLDDKNLDTPSPKKRRR
jgi:hypothetical protein